MAERQQAIGPYQCEDEEEVGEAGKDGARQVGADAPLVVEPVNVIESNEGVHIILASTWCQHDVCLKHAGTMRQARLGRRKVAHCAP